MKTVTKPPRMMVEVRAALARFFKDHTYSEAEDLFKMDRGHIHRILYGTSSIRMETYERIMEGLEKAKK